MYSDSDESLTFNNFTVVGPELTRIQQQTVKGVQLCCQEEKGPVWSVALADRASCSRAMPSTSRKRSRLARGVVDTKKTGGMVWRITQNVGIERAPALDGELPCSHPGRVPWVACGRGASRHSFDFQVYHVIDIPSLGRDVILSF